MDLWLRAFVALPENHAGDSLPPTCDLSPKETNALSWPPQVPTHAQNTHAQTCIQIKKINLLQKYLENTIRFLKINF